MGAKATPWSNSWAASRRPRTAPQRGRLIPRANLRAALALYFAYYNFCRMHKSIRMTPAMAAGITRKPRTTADLLAAAVTASAA